MDFTTKLTRGSTCRKDTTLSTRPNVLQISHASMAAHTCLVQATAKPTGTQGRRRSRKRCGKAKQGQAVDRKGRTSTASPSSQADAMNAELWGSWPFELDLFEYLDDALQAKEHGITLRTVSDEGGIVVKASLPEFEDHQVNVDIEGNELVITAERGATHLKRSFRLPRDTPAKDVKATFADGELVVTVPRPRRRHVDVEASSKEFRPSQGSVIMMKAPGYEPEDISIDVEGHKLILQGKDKEGVEFRKTHILLGDADIDRIAARCMHGTLQIFVPIATHSAEVDVLSTVDVDDEDTEHFSTLQFPVPGLRPEDFHIEAADGVLFIQAERTAGYHAHFERALVLPENVNVRGIRASVRDGVLTLILPTGDPVQDDLGTGTFHVPLQSASVQPPRSEPTRVNMAFQNEWNC